MHPAVGKAALYDAVPPPLPSPLHTPPPCIQLLEKLGVGVDQYELDWCGAGTRLDIPRSETWQLFVKETGQSSPSSEHRKPFGYLR